MPNDQTTFLELPNAFVNAIGLNKADGVLTKQQPRSHGDTGEDHSSVSFSEQSNSIAKTSLTQKTNGKTTISSTMDTPTPDQNTTSTTSDTNKTPTSSDTAASDKAPLNVIPLTPEDATLIQGLGMEEIVDALRDVYLTEIILPPPPLPNETRAEGEGVRKVKVRFGDLLPDPARENGKGESNGGINEVPGSGSVVITFLRRFGCGVCRYVRHGLGIESRISCSEHMIG